MRGHHKKWAAPFLQEHPEICLQEINADDAFLKASPLYLEIGMGKGDFLMDMSSRFPGNYLGLEREISILGMAAKKAVALEKKNVRLIGEDFDFVYDGLPLSSFDIIYLNFSDPWPKRRHWKRRLTTKERLNKMGSLLKEEGLIKIKTDNDDLYAFTLENAPLAKLETLVDEEDYQFDKESDSMSEYEASFRSQGKKIHRIILKKGKEFALLEKEESL